MSSIEEIRTQLRKGRIAEVEEAFLNHLEESPDDIDLFTAAARGLVGSGEDDRAAILLELLDEKLAAAGHDEHRLALLRETGAVRCPAADEHALMIDLIRRLYPESTSIDGLVETVGLSRAIEDRKKNWEKLDRLRSLLAYDLGAVVMMDGRGVGEVVEVNIALKKFKVDFHGHGGLRVGFAAAAKLLTPLAPGHILWRKLEDIEALKSLAKSDPPELLREVLASYEKPLTGTEIKQVLSGVITASGWTSWWGTARKHPQVVVHSGGRPAYSWAASAGDALSGLSARFSASDLAGKVDLYKQAAGRDADLKQRMGSELAARANLLRESDPPTALALYCILDRTGGPLDKVQWDLADLVPDAKTAVELLSKVKDRQHRELLIMMIAEKSEDRVEIFANYLPLEEVPKILDLVAERLRNEAPDRFTRVISSILSQPQTSPAAFVWLAERAGRDESLRESLSFRLLQQLLRALSLEALRPYRVRMEKLFESGGTVPRLLPLLDRQTAAKAEVAIGRCGTLEDFYRAPLLTAIHLRFPDLREGEQETIYALPESITARRAQLKELLEKEIPANRKAIEVAREMGDLRENFEYKAARQRHEYLAARASGLNGELERARPVDLTSVDTSEVRIGCTVDFTDDSGQRRISILGPWESQPAEGIISYESDLGRKLLGNEAGAALDLGNGEATIVAITAWEPSVSA